MKVSQEKRVWEYLHKVGPITSLHAREILGIIDLPKRVSRLRRRHGKEAIIGVSVTRKNRFGEYCTVKEYSIPKEQGQGE